MPRRGYADSRTRSLLLLTLLLEVGDLEPPGLQVHEAEAQAQVREQVGTNAAARGFEQVLLQLAQQHLVALRAARMLLRSLTFVLSDSFCRSVASASAFP